MIIISRIDSRLIHGQVIEAWLPALEIQRIVVADDDAAADALSQAAYSLAVPPEVKVVTTRVEAADFAALARDNIRTLVLLRTVSAAEEAAHYGLPLGTLVVGNVHAGPGKVAFSRSVFLDEGESAALRRLKASGMRVFLQAVPGEPQIAFS